MQLMTKKDWTHHTRLLSGDRGLETTALLAQEAQIAPKSDTIVIKCTEQVVADFKRSVFFPIGKTTLNARELTQSYERSSTSSGFILQLVSVSWAMPLPRGAGNSTSASLVADYKL